MTVGEDQFDKKLKLNLSIESPQVVVREDGTIDQPIRFYLYNNYPSMVRSYQITIYEARDAEQINPVQVIAGEAQEGWISWDGRLPRGAYWQPNHEYKAVLEVLGTTGKKDVVHPLFFKTLTMSDTATEKFKNVPCCSLPAKEKDGQAIGRGVYNCETATKAVALSDCEAMVKQS